MDIVSRLKRFIETHAIPVTQFADRCAIPRPTLSQLLNGRNKKVSDEVIAKIHAAYPGLSMMWLMFGEGSMESDANIAVSKPLESAKKSASTAINTDSPDDDGLLRFDVTYIADSPENMAKRQAQYGAYPIGGNGAEEGREEEGSQKPATITFDPRRGKRVISIVVYYDDKSYESFVPDPSGRSPFN